MRLLCACSAALAVLVLPSTAGAATDIVTGSVSKTARTAAFPFSPAAAGEIRGSLDWTTTSADLDLVLDRSNPTAAGRRWRAPARRSVPR